jgi:hydroxymethylbilane synthase
VTHPLPTESAARDDAETRRLVVGTRGSALALHQARHVSELLRSARADCLIEIEVISSEGDIDKESPLTRIGGRGVFTSSLQRALRTGAIDAAVHSSEDVPSLSAAGLTLAAFPQREDPRDVVVSRHGVGLAELPRNPVVGTSSRRRAAQVLALRPDARIADLRGNIDTRLRKAATEQYDAIILAAAGLSRMGWLDRATELLGVDAFTPAPGQGALAVETRDAPEPALAFVAMIDDPRIRQALEVERAFLRGIGGGCTTPLGAHALIETHHGVPVVRFWGMLARDDGAGLSRVYEEWPVDRAASAAFETALALVAEVRPNRVFGGGVERDRQLAGMRVIVTGTEDLVATVRDEVGRRGGEPVVMPTIRVESPDDPAALERSLVDLERGGFEWVVLTSREGVRAVEAALARLPDGVRVAAIGDATAAAIRAAGVEPAVVAAESRGEGMVAALESHIGQGDRVLLPVSSRARRVVEEGLRALGADVIRVDAYRTEVIAEADPAIVALVEKGAIGAVLLASPSAVEGFVAQLGTLLPALSGATFVAIGPVTAAAMEDRGLPVHAVAATPGGRDLVEALASCLWGETGAVERGGDR